MRDAAGEASNGWVREAQVSDALLGSLHELNHQFLELVAARAPEAIHGTWGGVSAQFAQRIVRLSSSQRAAASQCPYALFDLRFDDDAHWQRRLQDAARWTIADESAVDDEMANFARLALFFAWHVALTAKLAAQLLLGMSGLTASALQRLTVDRLPALAASEAGSLTARWSGCLTYWNALTGAAGGADAGTLRRVQLYGLQLAAASRLQNV